MVTATQTLTIRVIIMLRARNNYILADIHTHILPNIDDGASSLEEAVELVLLEKSQGVTDIVFTPHFSMDDSSVISFIGRREESFALLQEAISKNYPDIGINFHLGAEVKYNPHLLDIEIESLCIGNTSYLLLEPTSNSSFNLTETIVGMIARGITPILAHAERYHYLVNNERFLRSLSEAGALFQLTAKAFTTKNNQKAAKKLLRLGYADVIASDTHDLQNRPPCLGDAYKILKRKSDILINNTSKILENGIL